MSNVKFKAGEVIVSPIGERLRIASIDDKTVFVCDANDEKQSHKSQVTFSFLNECKKEG